MWVFAQHTDQVPLRLVPEGREEPTAHRDFRGRIEPLATATARRRETKLPVAALPEYDREPYVVSRAKQRPALVLSAPYPLIRQYPGSPTWQFSPNLLVCPYYGATITADRAGFAPAFVERVRRCEFPQYHWDILPLTKQQDSVMMFGQTQSIGEHHQAIELTEHELTPDALTVMDAWFQWFMTGVPPLKGNPVVELFFEFRGQYLPPPVTPPTPSAPPTPSPTDAPPALPEHPPLREHPCSPAVDTRPVLVLPYAPRAPRYVERPP